MSLRTESTLSLIEPEDEQCLHRVSAMGHFDGDVLGERCGKGAEHVVGRILPSGWASHPEPRSEEFRECFFCSILCF